MARRRTRSPGRTGELWTVGHGTADGDALGRLLTGAGVGAVVDVRRFPGSRRNPAVNREALAATLPRHGVAYRWDERLGGRRAAPPDSPDVALRHPAFAGYAAHMRTPEFAAGVAELLAAEAPTAVLCSESVWWRCHRRLIADHVTLVHGVAVHHVLPGGRVQDHRLTEGVRLEPDGQLVYDAGQGPLPGPEPREESSGSSGSSPAR